MSQLSILPIALVDEQPADRNKSKDLAWIGIDEQDRRYAIKTRELEAPLLPLIEWLCYHLCQHCGVPAPEFAVVVRLDGSQAFGSRWVEQAWQVDPAATTRAELELRISRARHDISAMFAIDAFMPNEDRHLGNMLFTHAGARARALAFDWSRTRLFEPWPWPAGCNSDQVWRWLQRMKQAEASAVTATLDRLQSLSETEMHRIISAAPAEWTEDIDVAALVAWWKNNRHTRAAQAQLQLLP